ncbi:hypothetical protein ONZ45_g16330 [Pleurotus djamor]|nr:hypothetical protein ONZ45_g16330 [Pleurotus djamor]
MPNYRSLTSKIDLTGNNVVAVGGTQGIGAGIALRCAELGASVLIVGRNPQRGTAVVESLKLKNASGRHRFVEKDLGTVDAIKEIVEEIVTWAGDDGVHYLYLSQGGPSCFLPSTVEVIAPGFNVQVLSHFLIPYLLLERPNPVLRKGAQICNMGRPGEFNRTIDFDDFVGLKAAAAGQFGMAHPFKWVFMMDVFTREFNIKYPDTHTTHLYPGPVATDLFNSSIVPWYIKYPSKLMFLFAPTPEKYADVAVWETASTEAKEKKTEFWDQYARSVNVDKRVETDAEFRKQVWENLLRVGGY